MSITRMMLALITTNIHRRKTMDNFQDFIKILKSITLGDIIGALCLVAMLYMGLFLVLIYQ